MPGCFFYRSRPASTLFFPTEFELFWTGEEPMKLARTLTALVALCVIGAPLTRAETIRVYHIGNSLTDNINYGGLGKLATSKGDTYTYGKDVSPGVPLDYTW